MTATLTHGSSSPPVLQDGMCTGLGPRKRKRKALSCYECRRRKVKCDRGSPSCNRCIETGQGNLCSYTLEPPRSTVDADPSVSAEDSNNDTVSCANASRANAIASDEVSTILRLQAERIAELEKRLAGSESTAKKLSREWKGLERAVVGSKLSTNENAMSKMQMYIEQQEQKKVEIIPTRGGKGFETKFYGATNPTSLIAHFPELCSFMKEALILNSSLARIQREIHVRDDQQKHGKVIPLVTNESLLALLPNRSTLDHLVKIYFDNFETVYRILHRPTFWDEYNSFWLDPQKGSSGFVPILLLIMATVCCISPKESLKSTPDSLFAREMWTSWIEVCDIWLASQSQKHLNLTNFQVRCLLLLSKQMVGLKEKRAWTSAVTLLSFSISAGLHRDPSLLSGKISIFDQEMRRRLWGTMVELELEASLDRGVRSFSADLPSDCPPPSNLDDGDFGMLSEQLPPQRACETFTATSFLCISQKTRSLRTSLMTIVNNPRYDLQYDEALSYEEKLLEMLKKLPLWSDHDKLQEASSKLPRMLLDMQLRQMLILLHCQFARKAESNPRYGYSRMVCVNTARYILDQYSALTSSGDYAMCFLRNDVERAALSLCHNVYLSSLVHDDLSFLIPGSSFLAIVDNALSMLADKTVRLDRGYKNYLFLSLAYSVLQSQQWPTQSETNKYEAIERVTRLYCKVRALKGDPPEGNMVDNGAIESAVVRVGENTSPSTPIPTVAGPEAMFPIIDLELESFDYGNLFDWTLGNLWPLDPVNQY